MLDTLLEAPTVRLAIAVGIGLMTGAERERRMAARGRRGPAGIRTFALVALFGGVLEQIGGMPLLAVGLAFVGAAAIAGYFREAADVGITTEVALVLTFLLGIEAQREPALASGLAVIVTVLLATRTTLHQFVSSVLTDAEVHDALLLAASVLVVLPLLPNRTIDPFEALNPFSVWRLVVLLLLISSAGYVAVRALGARGGLPVAGFIGGFVSSTATVSAMGSRGRATPEVLGPALAGALLSSVATVVQLALVLASISLATLRALEVALLGAGLVVTMAAGLALVRASSAEVEEERLDYGHAFNLRTAVVLAATMSLVTVASAIGARYAGAFGLRVVAAAGGLADVHAAAIGVASLVAAGAVTPRDGAIAILIAMTSNTASKIFFARLSGGSAFLARLSVGLVASMVAAWIGFALAQ